jgi:putative transposase
MNKSRFTDSQIIEAIKRAESGESVQGLCRELGTSQATFYKWRSKYGGMDTSLMARMKELEAECAQLRKMYVEEKLKAENEEIANWLLRLTDNHRRWGFMLCFLYLRNVRGFIWNHIGSGATSGCML